jgi:methane monooxygenase component A beta chain/propane monooxygenase small subunit
LPVALDGERTFNWIKSATRRPSEYEIVTVGLQSSPEEWIHVGWPLRFEDGRAPWSEDASRIRVSTLSDYRDPAEMWQRVYVEDTNQQQRTLERLVPVWTAEMDTTVDAAWREKTLERTYAAWPFVEYGLFLALAYVVRQCRADTVEFMTAFQAFDHLRLQQDIVQHLHQMTTDVPGFQDEDARDFWMTDSAMAAVREVVELIIASDDWFEIMVAINLAFEPLVGTVAKRELFGKVAALHGDCATPAIIAQSALDVDRGASCAAALVELAMFDPVHGGANRLVIEEWLRGWGSRCRTAAEAFSASLFPTVDTGANALAAAEKRHTELLSRLGVAFL